MTRECSICLRFIAALGLALSGGAANCFGDIETFWKTDTCPDFGGAKVSIASEVGVMEAVMVDPGAGVGGLFCHLLSTPPAAVPFSTKSLTVNNAAVLVNVGDIPGPYVPGDQWSCVVCQYEVKIGMPVPPPMTLPFDPDGAVMVSVVSPSGGVPAVSFLGTVVLMAGLVVAAVYAIQRRKDVTAGS